MLGTVLSDARALPQSRPGRTADRLAAVLTSPSTKVIVDNRLRNRHYCKSSFVYSRRKPSCASTWPTSVCFATWSKPAASPTAPNAQISRWPPPRTRIRNMEETLGVALLTRGRAGVTPTQAGRLCCSTPAPSCGRPSGCTKISAPIAAASRPDPRSLQHQRVDRVPAGSAEFVSVRASECQRRSGRAPERRDRRPDRRRAWPISALLPAPSTPGAGTFPFRRDRFVLVVARDHPLASAPRSASTNCSTTISSGSIAPARCSAF